MALEIPGRTWNNGTGYRYGWGGHEKDNEIKGEGNSIATHFRLNDPRTGRWFTMDPVTHFSQSPYTSMDNDPINLFDPWGANTEGASAPSAGSSGSSSGSSGNGSTGGGVGSGSGGQVTTPNGYGAAFAADWFTAVLGNLVMTNGFDYQVWNSGTGLYEEGREPRTWTGAKSLEDIPYEQVQIGDTYEQGTPDPLGVDYARGWSGDSHTLLYIGDYQWIELKGYSSYKSAEYATFFFPLGGGVRLGSKLLNWLSKFYAGKRVISVAKGVKNAYKIAKNGGRHSGWLKVMSKLPTTKLQKSIRTMEANILEHQNLISNPSHYMKKYGKGNWDSIDPRQQINLLNIKWPNDIQRAKEQINILQGIIKSR